jgi:hypothetical protein
MTVVCTQPIQGWTNRCCPTQDCFHLRFALVAASWALLRNPVGIQLHPHCGTRDWREDQAGIALGDSPVAHPISQRDFVAEPRDFQSWEVTALRVSTLKRLRNKIRPNSEQSSASKAFLQIYLANLRFLNHICFHMAH